MNQDIHKAINETLKVQLKEGLDSIYSFGDEYDVDEMIINLKQISDLIDPTVFKEALEKLTQASADIENAKNSVMDSALASDKIDDKTKQEIKAYFGEE